MELKKQNWTVIIIIIIIIIVIITCLFLSLAYFCA